MVIFETKLTFGDSISKLLLSYHDFSAYEKNTTKNNITYIIQIIRLWFTLF